MQFVAGTTQPAGSLARRPEPGGITTSASDVRVAVVGYGYWGSKHMRVFSSMPSVHVTIVDQDPDRIAEARRSYPSAESAHRLDAVLDRVDAVVVATPPSAHAEVGLQALRNGRHALVEKPLATTVEDAQEMVDSAAASGVHLMVGHTFEYNAAVWKLKEIIDSGELGRILYIDSARLSLGKYQRDCNVIWDLAPHDISIASYLLDEVPRTTCVWAKRHVGNRHADVAYLRLDFEQAATHAFVRVSWLDPCKVRRVTVVGERKMAVYDDMSDNERIRVYDIGVDPADPDDHGESHAMPVSYRTGDIVSPYIQFNEPLWVQDSHFIECIRTGAKPNTSGERGLDIVRVLAATDVAEATGRPTFIASSTDSAGAKLVRGVAS
jgi:predicted dehydrogenase